MPTRGSWRFANFYFFYFCTVGIIVPYWSVYLQHLQFSPTEIGQLTAILVITKVVAPNVWGSIVDRTNLAQGHSLKILKLATGGALVSYLFLYWPAQSVGFWWMAGVLFAYSVFWNACIPQVEAATLNHLAGERFRYGMIRLWGSVGFIVTVLGLGYLLDHYSPNIILHAGAVSFLAVFAVSFLLSRKQGNTKPDSTVIPLKKLLNKRVVLILVLCTMMQASHAPFYTFFTIYLEGNDYSNAHIGWLWSVGVVLEIVVFLLGYRLLSQYRLMNLLTFTFVCAALRWLLLAAFPQSVPVVWFAQALHAITYGLNHSVMMQVIDQFFQGRYQVRGQALYLSVSFGVGGALGSGLSGYIWSGFGANMLFYFSGFLMLIASLLAMIFLVPREETLPVREM